MLKSPKLKTHVTNLNFFQINKLLSTWAKPSKVLQYANLERHEDKHTGGPKKRNHI
jgi:hypothetical protein